MGRNRIESNDIKFKTEVFCDCFGRVVQSADAHKQIKMIDYNLSVLSISYKEKVWFLRNNIKIGLKDERYEQFTRSIKFW